MLAVNAGSASWRADTLTETQMPHSAARRAASASTKRPSGTISPVSSAIADEVARLDLPAAQRLERGDLARRRCAGSAGTGPAAFAPRSRAAGRSPGRAARARARCICASNTACCALPAGLRAVHGDVGVADQLLRVDVRPAERDPDRAGDEQLAPRDRERGGERREHALGDHRGLARVGHVLEQHGELVAAHARDGVAGAQRRVEPERDGAAAAGRRPGGRASR